MPEQPGAGRLDPETLAAYIDGLLPPEERARVDAEIAADPETYEWVVNSIGAVDDPAVATPVVLAQKHVPIPEPSPAPVPGPSPNDGPGDERKVLPFYRRRGVQGLLGTLLAAAAALVMVVRTQPVWWQEIWGPSVDPRFAKLVEAVGEERYIEARLTGGFKYGPLRQVMRGPGDLSNQNLQLLAAAGELQKAVERDPSAENLHAWGAAQLLLGSLDGAVSSLRSSLRLRPGPRVASDLAAALIARGQGGNQEDFPIALDLLLKQEAKGQMSAEALFNLALALEAVGLTTEATDAWKRFLEKEASGPWAEQARSRIAHLNSQGTYLEPEEAARRALGPGHQELRNASGESLRALAERVWFPGFCPLNQDPVAARAIVEALGSLALRTGDKLMMDATEREWGAQVCGAYASLRHGLEMVRKDQAGLARPSLHAAEHQFAALGHPFELVAAYHLGAADYATGNVDAAERGLARALVEAKSRSYRTIEAHAAWMSAVVKAAKSRYAEALLLLSEARIAAKLAEEYVLLGRIDNQMADLEEYSGLRRNAWVSRRLATTNPALASSDRLQYSVFGSVAAVLRRRELHHASALFLKRQIHASRRLGTAVSQANVLLRGVEGLIDFGLVDQAAGLLSEAEAAFMKIAESRQASGLRDRLFAARGLVALARGRPQDAVEAMAMLDESVMPGRELQRVDLLFARAIVLSQLGDGAAAARSIHEGLGLLAQRVTASASVFDSPELAAVRRKINVVLATGNLAPADALALSEAERRLVLSESRAPRTPAADSSTVKLFLRVAATKTIAWVARGDDVQAHELPISLSEAESLSECVLVSLAARHEAASLRCLGQAYDALLRPLEDELQGATRISLVPGYPFDQIPFHALWDSRRGAFLVETHEVVVNVSGRSSSQESLARPRAVGVVAPGRSATPALPVLVSSLEEASAITLLYPTGRSLLGGDATADNALRLGQDVDVLHFATHALVDSEDGRRSSIVLASDGDKPGYVKADDIARMPWGSLYAVVLAACDTAVADSRAASPLSIAFHVLKSGPEFVIASHVSLPDVETTRFVLSIHRHLVAGVGAPASVRLAQLEALRGSQTSKISVWSSVSIFN